MDLTGKRTLSAGIKATLPAFVAAAHDVVAAAGRHVLCQRVGASELVNPASIPALVIELYEQIGTLRQENEQLRIQLKTVIEQAQTHS